MNHNSRDTTATVSDQDIRDELLDVNQSFIVQAPAGSGKTEILTQRILALLANVQKPENVLAITFTRKAAAEMRERVITALLNGKNKPPLSAYELSRWKLAKNVLAHDKKNGWNLLSNPNRLNIYTIDALSAKLSGSVPLLSQTGTVPKIEENAFQLYQLAAERLLASIGDNDAISENIKTLLIHKDNNLKQVIDLIANLLGKRLQWLSRINVSDHELTCRQILASLETIIEEKIHKVYRSLPANIIAELPALLAQASSCLRAGGKKQFSNLAALSTFDHIGLPNSSDIGLWKAIAEMMLKASLSNPEFYKKPSKSNGFPLPKDAQNEIQSILFDKNKKAYKAIVDELSGYPDIAKLLNEVRILPDSIQESIENPALQSVIELLPYAASYLKLVFQEANAIDFNELSLSSLNALGNTDAPSDVALALDYKIEHILVDEFQDTSSPQIRLFELLTSGWDYSDSKSLFLVGDPMQSIYRFREANVSLFIQIANYGLGQLDLNFRQLQVNFRSEDQIVDWVNQQFDLIMPSSDDLTLSAVSYTASKAFSQASSFGKVKCYVTCDETSHFLQAQQILRIAKYHLDENHCILAEREKLNQLSDEKSPLQMPFKTMAILARSRNHLKEITDIFNQNQIAYQAIEIEPITKKMVVSDIVSLALALTDVYDELSWVSCLRSPWFALKLEDISIILTLLKHSRFSIPEILKELLNDELLVSSETNNQVKISDYAKQRILVLLPILQSAITQKGKKPFIKWLSGCFRAVGGLLQIDMQSELQDIDTCIEMISRYENAGEIIDRQGLKQALDGLYATTNPQADNQIQIMTIHKSKGLEFDRVILPRLDARAGGDDSALLKWTEVIDEKGQSHNLLAISKQTGRENDPIYRYIGYLDKQKEFYESQRVLYVACTRAKSELYLFANVVTVTKKSRTSGESNEPFKKPVAGSFLNLLWDGIKKNLTTIDKINGKTSTKNSDSIVPIPIAQLSEKDIASIDGLESTEAQLNYIFPTRKIKQCNIESIKKIDFEIVLVPEKPTSFKIKSIASEKTGMESESNWSASIVGTLLHRQLEWISKQGDRTLVLTQEWKLMVRAQLIDAGISLHDEKLEHHVDIIFRGVRNILTDEFGQLVLRHHDEEDSELVLHRRLSNGEFLTRVIDRTFVFENSRWIIDYKSSEPQENELLEIFLRREVRAYKQQIQEYVSLFKNMEQLKTIAGLYFPLIQHFEKIYED